MVVAQTYREDGGEIWFHRGELVYGTREPATDDWVEEPWNQQQHCSRQPLGPE